MSARLQGRGLFVVLAAVFVLACGSEGSVNPDCTPDCSGKECGDDGCGGQCGQCPAAAPMCVEGSCQVECTPACDGKECGDDGCGGECGTCPGAAPLCVEGICQAEECVPECGDAVCGDDGCGGSCGECGEGDACEEGACVCTPECGDAVCGDDGCGGSCGECGEGETCEEGACVCVPECGDAVCGDDGCGGSCGECEDNETCEEGACVCVPACGDAVCGDDGCGGSCGECQANEACEEGACVCVPACGDAVCGDDGCGGSCGECQANEACEEGACVCVPACGDAVCGDDGCGGSCGECGDFWQTCQDGACALACPDLEGEWWITGGLTYDNGMCFGQAASDGGFLDRVELVQLATTYDVATTSGDPDQPGVFDFAVCTYDVALCQLVCICDDVCLTAYGEALAEALGSDPVLLTGQAEYVFTLVDGYLALTSQVNLVQDGESCDYAEVTDPVGENVQCEACTFDANDCAGGFQCVDYANFAGNAFCSTLCVDDADCPEGYFCDEGNICWFPEESFVPACAMDDVWWDDLCGHTIGPIQECPEGFECVDGACGECIPDCADKACGDDGCGGSCGDCGDGYACDAFACVPAADGTIGAMCADTPECLAGDLPVCVPPDEEWVDGYCTSFCFVGGAGDCPAGATCFGIEGQDYNICLRDCVVDDDCRVGYICDPELLACVPPVAP